MLAINEIGVLCVLIAIPIGGIVIKASGTQTTCRTRKSLAFRGLFISQEPRNLNIDLETTNGVLEASSSGLAGFAQARLQRWKEPLDSGVILRLKRLSHKFVLPLKQFKGEFD